MHKISELGGAIKRARKGDAPVEINDSKTEAEVAFYKDQIKELKRMIRSVKASIKQTEEIAAKNITSVALNRNLETIDELKDELVEHEKELKFYQDKI